MLRLRNTLTRHVDPVEPLEPGRVRMYTCGPTVYRYAHVGNLRSYLLADLIRRTLLYHGLEVFHVKNITDVGHLRDERFDRGADPMLVAGRARNRRRRPRSPPRTRRPSTPTRRWSTSCRPTSSRGRPSTSPRCSRWPRRSRTPATPTRRPERQRLLRRRRRSTATGGCRATRSTDLRAGHRGDIEPDKRDPADFALWKAAGRGPAPQVADRALGRGLPGLAPRVLGDGDALSRAALRHPHRRHRQRLPAPRGRDRAVGADRRRRPGASLGPRRVPADGRQEDGQVGRQLPARHRAGRPGHRPAGVPLPGADLALRAQARVLGSVARRGRGRARVAAGRVCARSGRRRPTGRGRRRRCSRARAPPAIDPRASHRVSPATAATRPATWSPTAPRHRPLPSRPTAARFHDRFVAAIDDDLDMPVALALLREILRSTIGAGRAALARPRCRRGPRSRPPSRLGDGGRRGGRARRGPRPRRRPRSGPGGGATIQRPTACGHGSMRSAGTSSTRRAVRRSVLGPDPERATERDSSAGGRAGPAVSPAARPPRPGGRGGPGASRSGR